MWRRAISRFGFAYWILFCLEVFTQIFDFEWLDKAHGHLRTELGLFVGRIVGIDGPIPTARTGSGDTTLDYLVLLAVAGLALFVTGVWTGLDREGRHDEKVRAFVRTMLRYSLAFLMLSYGIAKLDIGHNQFPPPNVRRLTQKFGDASPMGMLWTFMGTSQAYTKFAGIGEILGGTLLLSRRTTLAGALLLIPVLTNIVMMNFCYDVPVKINSAHYLAMAIVLVLPDIRRILDVVVFRRAVDAPPPLPVLRFRGRRAPVIVAKVLVLAAFFVPTYLSYSESSDKKSQWFDGYWQVESFTRDGVVVPAVVDDKTRWNRLKLETDTDGSYMRWHNMDGSMSELYVMSDRADDHFTFKRAEGEGPNVTFAITRPDSEHWTISTQVDGHALQVAVKRLTVGQTPLLSRGFHWINEVPYNR